MTTIELEAVVARHERQCLELKESFGAECLETACAFANAGGGYIVIGVDDAGRPSRHALRNEGLRDYENRISTATEPSVAVDAESVPFGGREVVVLRVSENPLKPVACKGRCFMRKGSVNHQMTPSEIAECHLRSTGGSMDAVFVPGATRDEMDMDAVRRYMKKAVSENRRAFASDEDPWRVLVKLGLVKSEHEITRAAYLLFAKEPQMRFSQAVIHAGAFKADGAVIIDAHDARGNIQDQIEETLAFLRRNMRCAIVVTGKAEHDRYWEYPLDGLREALANAVCHRDYALPNDIQVKIFENRVVIMNPGPLPFDMSIEELEDPDHPSRPRNKLIAQILYDLHVIERYGSGVRRIRSDCDKNGSPYPTWESAHGECTVKFWARTEESISRLGISPDKFGVMNRTAVGEDVTGDAGLRDGRAAREAVGEVVSEVVSDVVQQIYLAIKGNPGLRKPRLLQIVKTSRATAERALARLRKEGKVAYLGTPKTGGYFAIGAAVSEAVNEVVSEAVNEVVSDVVRQIYLAIKGNPGLRKPRLLQIVKTSRATAERALARLRKEGKVAYRGTSKTGGYFVTVSVGTNEKDDVGIGVET